jgi:hypothetical protein
MPSFTDAVQPIDTLKHFRDSYNTTRGELDGVLGNGGLKHNSVNEEFQYFTPNLVQVGGNATGKFNAWEWSAVDGGVNNNQIGVPPIHIAPVTATGEALKFKFENLGTFPADFLMKARTQFVFGANPGQLDSITVHVRYALVRGSSTSDVDFIFGLYEGSNIVNSVYTPVGTNRSFLVKATMEDVATQTFQALRYGIGAPVADVFTPYDTDDDFFDVAIRVTRTSVEYRLQDEPLNINYHAPSQIDGIVFNLGFALRGMVSNSSLSSQFIDNIGYELTVN